MKVDRNDTFGPSGSDGNNGEPPLMGQPREPWDRLLTAKEAGVFLGKRPKTLANWRWKGIGPADCPIEGRIHYWLADLYSYLKNLTRRSTSDPGHDGMTDRPFGKNAKRRKPPEAGDNAGA